MQNLAKGGQGELGVFKKEGGAAASSVRGTGRQCLKFSLVILRGEYFHKGGVFSQGRRGLQRD